jgi:hypothetical protein
LEEAVRQCREIAIRQIDVKSTDTNESAGVDRADWVVRQVDLTAVWEHNVYSQLYSSNVHNEEVERRDVAKNKLNKTSSYTQCQDGNKVTDHSTASLFTQLEHTDIRMQVTT